MTKTRICPICGKEFIPRPNQKYCSPSCKSAHYYRELEARKRAREKIDRLEKEADWLASQLIAKDLCFMRGGFLLDNKTQEEWRESARKAVEAQNDNP